MDEVRGRRSAEAELRRWIAGALFALRRRVAVNSFFVSLFPALLCSHFRPKVSSSPARQVCVCFCPGRQFVSPQARQEFWGAEVEQA